MSGNTASVLIQGQLLNFWYNSNVQSLIRGAGDHVYSRIMCGGGDMLHISGGDQRRLFKIIKFARENN